MVHPSPEGSTLLQRKERKLEQVCLKLERTGTGNWVPLSFSLRSLPLDVNPCPSGGSIAVAPAGAKWCSTKQGTDSVAIGSQGWEFDPGKSSVINGVVGDG
ncbi:hypothetical protein BSKO_11656 [Bryopsis sp. KO-2023]|nr:hypothetical protein BSKO_11656 [Bryopsis sp. KO-2023]